VVASKEDILKLEDAIAEIPNVDYELEHYFSDELYARSMHLKSGTVFTGKEHKRAHISFLLKGTVKIMTDEGVELLEAPAIITSKKGTKRAGYAVTDIIFTTVHHCISTNIEDAENELVKPGRDHIVEPVQTNKIEAMI